jgi:hypothetical protein
VIAGKIPCPAAHRDEQIATVQGGSRSRHERPILLLVAGYDIHAQARRTAHGFGSASGFRASRAALVAITRISSASGRGRSP